MYVRVFALRNFVTSSLKPISAAGRWSDLNYKNNFRDNFSYIQEAWRIEIDSQEVKNIEELQEFFAGSTKSSTIIFIKSIKVQGIKSSETYRLPKVLLVRSQHVVHLGVKMGMKIRQMHILCIYHLIHRKVKKTHNNMH